MPNFDMNKNSLPEQVQENKEKIAQLETDVGELPTKEYVDDHDTSTLNAAKLYADQTKIPISFFTQKGQIMCAGALGDIPLPSAIEPGNAGDVLRMGNSDFPVWQAPTDIDKSIFTGAGSLITSDADNEPEELQAGNEDEVLAIVSGKPAWKAISSGGMTLLWAGSQTLTNSLSTALFTPELNKRYVFAIKENYSDLGKTLTAIIGFDTSTYNYTTVIFGSNSEIRMFCVQISNNGKFAREFLKTLTTSITDSYPNTYVLTEIYEVN